MKSISNYITEKYKINSETAKDIKTEISIQNLNHKQKLEYLDKIFPIENHKDMWENCKFIKFDENKALGRNYDRYYYGSIVKFSDDLYLDEEPNFMNEKMNSITNLNFINKKNKNLFKSKSK